MLTDYRWTWVRMAALSYVVDGDLTRAQSRLEGLAREDVADAMGALITEYANAGRPAETMRRLATLAETLGVHTPAMSIYLNTPTPPTARVSVTPFHTLTATSTPFNTPTPTATPTATPKPKPTRTPRFPTSTSESAVVFYLAGLEQICNPGESPHIEVVVQDEDGQGLAGVEVWLMWPGGADRAVTGLKPQQGKGYVDFGAEPDENYTLGTSALGVSLVTDLQIEPCPEQKGKEPMLGSWRVVLQRQSPPTPEPESESSE
jgi:hypothetical protein